MPDRVSMLRFGNPPSPRHLMEGHDLTRQFFEIDATIIAKPSSTQNSTGKRDPEMHQNNTRFGLSSASLGRPRLATHHEPRHIHAGIRLDRSPQT